MIQPKKQPAKKPIKITEETTLAAISRFPNAEKILAKHNLPCLHCPMARYESQDLKLGQVAEKYGIDKEKMLKELNEAIS
jgi:hypothetical protein